MLRSVQNVLLDNEDDVEDCVPTPCSVENGGRDSYKQLFASSVPFSDCTLSNEIRCNMM